MPGAGLGVAPLRQLLVGATPSRAHVHVTAEDHGLVGRRRSSTRGRGAQELLVGQLGRDVDVGEEADVGHAQRLADAALALPRAG